MACGTGAQVGQHYQARLDEPYTDAAFATLNPSCAGLDGLAAGLTLPFTLTGEKLFLDRCWAKLADVTLPTSVQITGPAEGLTGNYNGTFGVFLKTVSMGGGCAGTMEIKLDAVNNRPSDPRSSTAYPPFLVTRSFRPDAAASCPSFPASSADMICGDTWVASLSIVP